MHHNNLVLTVVIFVGSVAKITGKEGLVFEGTAKVYDSEELMMAGLNRKEITKGKVIIYSFDCLILTLYGDCRHGSCYSLRGPSGWTWYA